MTQPAEVAAPVANVAPPATEISPDAIPNLFLPDEEEASVGAAPAEEAPPEAAAPAVAAPAVADKVAARIATAKRAELKAARERAEIRRERAELDAYKTKIAKIKENPIAAIQEIGLDPDEFLKRVISDGKPSPESELAEIKAQIRAQAEENLRLKTEREQYVFSQTVERAKDTFVQMVEANHDKYAHLLDEYTPEEIREYGFEVARREGQAYKEETGEDITDEVIAQRLNDFARERSEKRTAWRQRVTGASKAGQAPVESVKVASPPVNRAPVPRTLTNGSASQRQSAPSKRTQEEIDAECIRILEQSMKGS